MTASWDSFARPSARPRRIRGGEIPIPSGVSWREQQRQSRAQAEAQRKSATGRAYAPADAAAFGFRLGVFWIDGDALFAFALFLPMVYLVQFGAMGAAMIAGVTPIYLFFRRRRLERVVAPRLFLFAFPAFALFSAVWSSETKETLKFALELCVTVTAAMLLASAQNQRAVIKAIALAFFIYTVDALLMGGQVLVGASGAFAFSGLTQSKNLMAEIASTGMLASLAVVFMSLRWRQWGWLALFALAAALELYTVLAARSAGALLGLAMGLLPLLALSPLVSAGRPLRAWLTGAVAASLVVVAMNLRAIMTAMITLGAQTFDKDPTLTGRTYLWYRAYDLIHEKPILGRGYFSFWLQGNIDAEGLWRYAGIVDRSGFNFHNTLVDLLVTVGWLGAIVLIVTVLIGAVALIRRFIGQPSLPLVFWIAILLYQLARSPIETVAIQPFYFSTTLAFAALGVAFGRHAAPRPAHRPIRSAVPVQVWSVDYANDAWANPRLAPARGSLRLLRDREPKE